MGHVILGQGAPPAATSEMPPSSGLDETSSPTFAGMQLPTLGVGMGTTLVVTPEGQVRQLTSAIRFKENVRPLHDVVDPRKLFDLKGVAFNYKGQRESDVTFGYLADDVDRIMPELVIEDDKGRPHSIQYDEIAVLLVPIVAEIDAAQKTCVDRIHTTVRAVEAMDREMHEALQSVTALVERLNNVEATQGQILTTLGHVGDRFNSVRDRLGSVADQAEVFREDIDSRLGAANERFTSRLEKCAENARNDTNRLRESLNEVSTVLTTRVDQLVAVERERPRYVMPPWHQVMVWILTGGMVQLWND